MQPIVEARLAIVDVASGLTHALGVPMELTLHVDEAMPSAGAAPLLLRLKTGQLEAHIAAFDGARATTTNGYTLFHLAPGGS